MPIFIKPGFWVKSRKQLEGYLNIDNLIQSLIPPTPPVVSLYKSYVAVISQAGTDAPTATVLENTLGETITLIYAGPGEYYVNGTNDVFTANKTAVMFTPGRMGGAIVMLGTTIASESFVVLYSYLTNGTLANSLLNGAVVEIRVYN